MPLHSPTTAISNGIAALHREHYGRGANTVRTTIHNDYVITVLTEPFTPAERLMIDSGEFNRVRDTRTTFQDLMREPFTAVVEEATGRKVVAFFSQISEDPPTALEFFVLQPDPVDQP